MTGASDWRKVILTLPDSIFFNLMRNYLGDITTPFHKPALIRELERLLRRKDTQSRLLSLVTTADAEVLTAIEMLDNPSFEGLQAFFADDVGYAELNEHLLNLENRLWVYRDGSPSAMRLHINPLLRPLARKHICRASPVFAGRKTEVREADRPWIGESLLLGMLSYLIVHPVPIRKDGSLKKKSESALRERFPGQPMVTLIGALLRMGLIRRHKEQLRENLAAWRLFAGLSPQSRLLLVWAATAREAARVGAIRAGVPVDNCELRETAAVLGRLCLSLPVDYAFSWQALRRIFFLLARRSGDLILPSLIDLGLLVRCGRDAYAVNPAVKAMMAGPERSGWITVQPNFEITLHPELSLKEGLPVALCAEIRRHDLVPSFEITRKSIEAFFNRDGSARSLESELGGLSRSPIPQNVLFSLRHWEEEYRGFALFDGIVLLAEAGRTGLLEHVAAPYLHKKISAGVYLISREAVKGLQLALDRAGVEFVPAVREVPEGNGGSAPGSRPDPDSKTATQTEEVFSNLRLEGCPAIERWFAETAAESTLESVPEPGQGSLQTDLFDELDRLKSKYNEDQVAEMRKRIEDRLILAAGQLKPIRRTAEKKEARGLDYIGKIRLIERALKENALLDVIERTRSGKPRRLTLAPERLEKAAAELYLVAITRPVEMGVRIKISKLGLVRIVSRSIFQS